MSPACQRDIKMTARVMQTQFLIVRVYVTLGGHFRRNVGLFKYWMFPGSKMTVKWPMDPNIQKLSSRYPCDLFGTYVVHMAHTDQKIEQFECFYFWHLLKSENLRFSSRARPEHPRLNQKLCKQEEVNVGIQKNRTCVHRTRNPNKLHELKTVVCFP